MAEIKVKDMLIHIFKLESGEVKACVSNTEKHLHDDVIMMNKNLKLLIQSFKPSTEYFGMPATNAIALWLVKGFGHQAEVIRFDVPPNKPRTIK